MHCLYQNLSCLMYVVVWFHWYPLFLVPFPAVSPSDLVDLFPLLLVLCSSDCSRWVWDVPHQLPPPCRRLVGEISIPYFISLFSSFFEYLFWLKGMYFAYVLFFDRFCIWMLYFHNLVYVSITSICASIVFGLESLCWDLLPHKFVQMWKFFPPVFVCPF